MPDERISSRESSSKKDGSTPRLTVAWSSAYREVLENLRELLTTRAVLRDPADSPLRTPCLKGRDALFPQAQGLSLAVHALLVTAMLLYAGPRVVPSKEIPEPVVPLFYPAPEQNALKQPSRGGGNGSGEDLKPPTHGKLPPFDWRQIAPPGLPKDRSTLEVPPNLVGSPDTQPPQIEVPNWGSPLLKDFTGSPGPGGRDGIGDGCCGGIGPGGRGAGHGPGEEWGYGGGLPQAGRVGVSEPLCVYCPNPTYTEEARKAKYQGTVLLRAIITADGYATNIQVIKGLGLGLDERAVEAVRNWRFKPALGPDGRPVAAWSPIEINFRIY